MIRRIRPALLLGASALLLPACGGLVSGSGADDERTVLVDYVDDEVASAFALYFPREVRVHPGDEVVFRQEWTGEPHSVTAGTLVDTMMDTILPLLEKYADVPEEEIPKEALEAYYEAGASLPPMVDDGDDLVVVQAAAQPCYLDEGAPQFEDPDVPCSEEDREQPAFDGTQSYYNSGFIPYQGEQGNEFRMPLSEDIEPGAYWYYCNIHGPFQSGIIEVVPEDEEIPSQEEVNRQARAEIQSATEKVKASYASVADDGRGTVYEKEYEAPIAGWGVDDPEIHAIVNEFIPSTIEASVGDTVTWEFVGGHTVSFDVPRYVSPIEIGQDGTVDFVDEAWLPVEIDVPAPPQPEEGVPPEEQEPPPPPVIDGGEWDGEGFISTGVQWEGRFELTFTESGTYRYACLIHPQMVGTVVVE